MEVQEYRGYNGTLVLDKRGVTIKRGAKGFMLGGGMLRGDKTIPYRSITAVQLKMAGLTAGYIQLSLQGGREAKGGLFQSTKDENSVHFYQGKNKQFQEAKAIIEERIEASLGGAPATSNLDELKKLAELKEAGVITEDEFEKKKKELLNG